MLLLVLTSYLFVQGPRLQLRAWHFFFFFFCPARLFPVFDRLASLDRPRRLGFPKKVMKKVFTHKLNTLSVYPAKQSNYTEVLGLLVRDFFSIFFLFFCFFFWLFLFSDRLTQNQGTHSTANKKRKWPKR